MEQPSIKEIRKIAAKLCNDTRLSQADIARQLGVSAKTLNAWLTESVTCRHRRMLMLALEALTSRLTK